MVFTDLDGTLLDHDTYSFETARPGLDALKAARIPLVLASSNMRAEMCEIAPQVGACGLILENGGGVDWPVGLQPPEAVDDTVSHAQLRTFLDERPVGLRSQVRGFSGMSDKDVAALTGLPLVFSRASPPARTFRTVRVRGL